MTTKRCPAVTPTHLATLHDTHQLTPCDQPATTAVVIFGDTLVFLCPHHAKTTPKDSR